MVAVALLLLLESALDVSFGRSLYGIKSTMVGWLKSISVTIVSPPSRSLNFRIFCLSRALMNFFAFFQLVFFI